MESIPAQNPFGPLRRKDREITSPAEIAAVLGASTVMRLGLADRERPFVVPVFYLYDRGAVFFHSAKSGTKMAIMRRNPSVCFEVSDDCSLLI